MSAPEYMHLVFDRGPLFVGAFTDADAAERLASDRNERFGSFVETYVRTAPMSVRVQRIADRNWRVVA